jgi:perosamine synthetase
MEFDFFDSSDCGFPKPKVPVLPPLTRHSLARKLPHKQAARWQTEGLFNPLEKSTYARHYARGRYALFEAYRLAGVGDLGAVLVPAYHCPTMLDPALRLGAEIDFYPLNADLSPQLEAISVKLRSRARPVKALLATHYFGFPQEFASLAALCAQFGVALIEDCSHTLFAPVQPSPRSTHKAVGETGQFGIASPYKFYPSEDGGLLWFNAELSPTAAPPNASSAMAELKGLRSCFQRNRANGLVPDIGTIDHEIAMGARLRNGRGRDNRRNGSSPSIFYQPAEEGQQSLAWSQWIFRHTNITRLAGARRENYKYWVNAVANLPAGKALLPVLPTDCVPYMFPLLIDSPQEHFHLLKLMGVPVWRWDEMAVSGCPVAAKYRLSLLHLPCHQELTSAQMNWMAQVVRQVLSLAVTSE